MTIFLCDTLQSTFVDCCVTRVDRLFKPDFPADSRLVLALASTAAINSATGLPLTRILLNAFSNDVAS